MKTVAETNELLDRFVADLTATAQRERRSGMASPLYDLPGRSSLGFAVTYEVSPTLVRLLDQLIAPEELGRRMARPLSRPYFLQPFLLIDGFLMGRQRPLIEAGPFTDAAAIERDAADTAVIFEWYERLCRAYRVDGDLQPGAAVLDQPILRERDIAPYRDAEPLDPERAARAQRAVGMLEIYALTLHGEQRDGNFDHGPYRLEDGRQLHFHELNDLDNRFLPWVEEGQRLGVDAVGVVRRFGPEVEIVYDLFGTSSVHPSSRAAEFEQLALLVREGETLRPLPLEELEELGARANQATGELLARIATWDDDYRTAYGRPLWLNHLAPLLELAGAADRIDWLRQLGDAAGPKDLAKVRSPAANEVWARLATDGEVFSHVRA